MIVLLRVLRLFSNRWGSGRNKSLAASAKHYANSQLFEYLVLRGKPYVDGGFELVEDRDEGISLDRNALAELVRLEVEEVHEDLLVDEEL